MKKKIFAIDPGFTESAYVLTDGETLFEFGKILNPVMLSKIETMCPRPIFLEMIASYGMPVGREVFETCLWIGRFYQASSIPPTLIYRKDVKANLCGGHPKATDANIRQALVDRFGPGKEKAVGKKATPGPLYGVSGDVWAALAVAVTALDMT